MESTNPNDCAEKIATDFHYSIWCNETYYLVSNPWYLKQDDVADTRCAAEAFAEMYDKENHLFFAKICSELNNIVIIVQDWRGRIEEFEILIEAKPVYIARRVK